MLVESDSSVAVQLINAGCDFLHPYGGLVNQIRAWKDRAWEYQYIHVCREVNQVTDKLANLAHVLGLVLMS